MTNQVLMARQPILDQNFRVVAYELLYRDENNRANSSFFDGSEATMKVILNSFTGIFDAGRFRKLPAFINLDQAMIEAGDLPGLPKEGVVLEILEDVKATTQVVEQVTKLAQQGYRLALDDFEYHDDFKPLLELCDVVKLDIRALTEEQLREHVEQLKPFKVTLLAEKIETYEEFQLCLGLGCTLFQGYFLSKPQLVEGKKLSTNNLVLLELISELDRSDVTPESLERIISRDPELTIKVLKIVNSAAFSLERTISSIAEAIVIIGIKELKKWALLLSVSQHTEKPSEISRQLLCRARMTELMAGKTAAAAPSAGFMAGILSGLDALLDLPIHIILEQIPLEPELKAAVTESTGNLGILIQDIKAYMAGDWDSVSDKYSLADLAESQNNAMQWTSETQQMMAS